MTYGINCLYYTSSSTSSDFELKIIAPFSFISMSPFTASSSQPTYKLKFPTLEDVLNILQSMHTLSLALSLPQPLPLLQQTS